MAKELDYEGGLEDFGKRVVQIAVGIADSHFRALASEDRRMGLLQLVSACLLLLPKAELRLLQLVSACLLLLPNAELRLLQLVSACLGCCACSRVATGQSQGFYC